MQKSSGFQIMVGKLKEAKTVYYEDLRTKLEKLIANFQTYQSLDEENVQVYAADDFTDLCLFYQLFLLKIEAPQSDYVLLAAEYLSDLLISKRPRLLSRNEIDKMSAWSAMGSK
ncbi:MAG: hypothetical protein JJU23_10160 [Cyclobacteriaceae bacterium]|nr:hypothetical protein [Cyclobacteriaceae bacterium]